MAKTPHDLLWVLAILDTKTLEDERNPIINAGTGGMRRGMGPLDTLLKNVSQPADQFITDLEPLQLDRRLAGEVQKRDEYAQFLRWQAIEEEQVRAWRQRLQDLQAACPFCGLAADDDTFSA